ncbi:MAG: hypothetical protein KBD26_02700 [Candidatus Pacebacteria bacterium]|nr:hypothetical protein [Candidatus Paceibacterota bacterium]MBP9772720.1 hypothetical protein [Candidatus Paceibacterota bacterium]
MIALVIIFFVLLVTSLVFLMYKTGQIRNGALPMEKKHEFGDKDGWLKQRTKKYIKITSIVISDILFSILVWFFKNWVRINRKLYRSIKRRFPEVAYVLGEKPKIQNINDTVPASSFIANIREHRETIKTANGETRSEISDTSITRIVTPVLRARVATEEPKKRRLKVRSDTVLEK